MSLLMKMIIKLKKEEKGILDMLILILLYSLFRVI